MTEIKSDFEYAGRHRKVDFDAIVPNEIANPPIIEGVEQLQPQEPHAIDMNRPLGVAPDHDVLAEINAGGQKLYYLVDIRKTPQEPDGSRLFDGLPMNADYLLVSNEAAFKRGYAEITGPDPDRVTSTNAQGNFRVGRGYLKDAFDGEEGMSRGHFDIVFDEENRPVIIDLASTNGTDIRQGTRVEATVAIPPVVAEETEPGYDAELEQLEEPETEPAKAKLNPAEVFSSSEALMQALHNPDQFEPAEYQALESVIRAWRERGTARAVGEAWSRIKPKLEVISNDASDEGYKLRRRIDELEQFSTSIATLCNHLSYQDQGDDYNAINRYRVDTLPPYTAPAENSAREELFEITEIERDKLRAVSEAASESDLNERQAKELITDVQASLQNGHTMAEVEQVLRQDTVGGGERGWLTILRKIEEVRAFSDNRTTEAQDYALLGAFIRQIDDMIEGGNRDDVLRAGQQLRGQLTLILENAYSRQRLLSNVTNIQPS